MAIEWFDKKAGSSLHAHQTEPGMYLVGDHLPSYVRTPPELGEKVVSVLSSHTAVCPRCGEGEEVRHLVLESGLCVAECRYHKFVWYTEGQR